MNIPIEIICVFLTAAVALQAWTLMEMVKLKVKVAAMIEHCRECNARAGKTRPASDSDAESTVAIKYERQHPNPH